MIQTIKSLYSANKGKTKVLSIAFVTVFVKSLVNIAIVKLIALTSNPGTLALYSQLLNINALATNFTTASVTTGVVKVAAENKESPEDLQMLRTTIYKLNIGLGVIVTILFFAFSEPLSSLIFGDPSYKHIVALIGISAFFSGLVLIATSLANGLGFFRVFLTISLVTSAVLVACILFLGKIISGNHFLFAFLFAQILSFLFLLPSLIKSKLWALSDYLKSGFNKKILRELSSFALMSVVATILVNVSQMVIRLFIIKEYSIDIAAQWDAMIKLSNAYFAFLTAGLGIYFLPKIAASHSKEMIMHEAKSMLKLIFPFLILMLACIYLLRDYIILLLYSKDFSFINIYFFPILISDLFKWLGWLFAYILMAKSATKVYLLNETAITIVLIGTIILFANTWGIIGIFYAYTFVFIVYFLSSFFLSQKILNLNS